MIIFKYLALMLIHVLCEISYFKEGKYVIPRDQCQLVRDTSDLTVLAGQKRCIKFPGSKLPLLSSQSLPQNQNMASEL